MTELVNVDTVRIGVVHFLVLFQCDEIVPTCQSWQRNTPPKNDGIVVMVIVLLVGLWCDHGTVVSATTTDMAQSMPALRMLYNTRIVKEEQFEHAT
jgi:hypothetical protein